MGDPIEVPCRLNVGQGSRGTRVVGENRLAVRRSLREPHRPRDHGGQHDVAKVLPHLLDHLGRQPGPAVVHREENRTHPQVRVQVLGNQVDRAKQLGDTLEGVVLALDRQQELTGSNQGVECE